MRFLKEENIEAYQWFKNGDHPKDDCDQLVDGNGTISNGEGKVVGYFPYPDDADKICERCNKAFSEHGKIGVDLLLNKKAGEGPEIICPGTWIQTHNITHTSGGPEKYNARPDITSKEYQGNFHTKCVTAPRVDEMELLKARWVFNVMIGKNIFPVYSIDNRYHWNGTSTWWVKVRDEGDLEPWTDHAHRICFEYNIREYNRSKVKWDEYRISKGVHVTITANGKPFYEFGSSDTNYAFAKAQQLVVQLMEHPYNFLEPESENGRKIYFYGMPATIRASSHPGEIGIIPDYSVGINRSQWWKMYKQRKSPATPQVDDDWDDIEKEHDEENMESDYINWGDALSDQHINWFRKDDKPKSDLGANPSPSL